MKSKTILGAITGDIIGSIYEWNNVKTTEFALFTDKSDFTDDSVLTVATMECLLSEKKDYTFYYREYGRKYPGRGYGGHFGEWLHCNPPQPYSSWGNGSAMRVSPE
jgi:ADP-ribosylglycohydrolase